MRIVRFGAMPFCLLLGLCVVSARAGEIVILRDVTGPVQVDSSSGARPEAREPASQRLRRQANDMRQGAREFVDEDGMTPDIQAPLPAGATYYRAQDADSNASTRRAQARQYVDEGNKRQAKRCNTAASSVGTIGDGAAAAKSPYVVERNNQSVGNTCP